VTKPIAQWLANPESQPRATLEKAGPAKNQEQTFTSTKPRTEVETMAFVPSRARKTTTKKGAKPEIIDQIGQHLGKVYNDVLHQPVPDRFLDLLQSLESGETPKLDRSRSAVKYAAPVELEASAAGERKKDSK